MKLLLVKLDEDKMWSNLQQLKRQKQQERTTQNKNISAHQIQNRLLTLIACFL